jgi:hypothetical protein
MNTKSLVLIAAGIIAVLGILIVIQVVIGMLIFLVKIGLIVAVLASTLYLAYYLWSMRGKHGTL